MSAEDHTYKFHSSASCGGVKPLDVSLDTQSATVTAEPSLSYENIFSTVGKTGTKVNSGDADGKEMSVVTEAAA
ncbi:unnamed protein product [Diplocarpon coronariae]